MIGDIILAIVRFLRQTFCLHDYRTHECGEHEYDKCAKCGRIKSDDVDDGFVAFMCLSVFLAMLYCLVQLFNLYF